MNKPELPERRIMTERDLNCAIGPTLNPLDKSAWHTSADGNKMYQLGIHVCKRGTHSVDFIHRTIHVTSERYELITSANIDALMHFDVNCKKAYREIYDSIIELYGSLENIDFVATTEGWEGTLH